MTFSTHLQADLAENFGQLVSWASPIVVLHSFLDQLAGSRMSLDNRHAQRILKSPGLKGDRFDFAGTTPTPWLHPPHVAGAFDKKTSGNLGACLHYRHSKEWTHLI
jgi:hypothetical protein